MGTKTEPYRIKLSGEGISIDRVISEIVARQIMNLAMSGTGPDAPVSSASPAADGRISAPQPLTTHTTPKAFMAAKLPRTDVERVACLAYFLTHQRSTPLFKTRELTDLNIEAAQPKLSNGSFAARNAVTLNYLSLAGKGQKQITARGEAIVDALPDRDKVRAALDALPNQKRKKSKRSSKAK